jgi:ATP synthase protein I
MASAARFGALGIEIGVSVIGGFLLGHWLDGKFGTEPVLLFVGLAFGAAAGFLALFKAVKRYQLDMEAAEEAERRKQARRRDDEDRGPT